MRDATQYARADLQPLADAMSLSLYAHPFSSYGQKVLIALYENKTPFDFRLLEFGDAAAAAEFAALSPFQRMPVLVDDATPMQRIVFDSIRAEANRDPEGVRDARALLDTAYRWLDDTIKGREWAAGSAFSLADCAAAPALFYADWVHPIAEEFANARAYRRRLLARPSFARAVDEARPYRPNFPPGAPNRD